MTVVFVRLLDEVGQNMSLKMIDLHKRLVQGQSEPLSKGCTDKKGAEKSRATGKGNGRNVSA